MVQEFDKVGVVGLGAMGAGIAEVFARAGFNVTGVEIDQAAVDRGRAHVDRSLSKAVDKGKLTEDERTGIDARLTFTTSREDLADADFVVEAVPERMDIKKDVFADLDRICPPGTILATNTSSLSVTEIAALTGRADKVVGLHFFNPAPVMKLVEVITTVSTSAETVDVVCEVAKRIGKTPVAVGDRAGFVANALLVPYINDAIRLYERKVATREEIDASVQKAAGLPMGPLALADLVGLDICLAVMDVLWEEYRDRRYAASPLLRRMVAAGRLGRKSGQGFYAGTDDAPEPRPTGRYAQMIQEEETLDLGEVLLAPQIDDAMRMVGDGYASARDVDTAMRFGCGYPKGPTELLEERGAEAVVTTLVAMGEYGLTDIPVPAPLLMDQLPDAPEGEGHGGCACHA
ncbi:MULTISPECIES: 3-hydroxyacyl-CoA dehydrogenase [Nocardiopsis]|uniref:3-hydroxybutyryl-CoA dehydrogenase n=1 Tax=Nocardiopsis dassonvillei (strain ATCC 23218 / DSM 43111 / CIP 107115 / JCM 7437 / KCTC 9190 / NBRC 14626 / NCTC 10488 / NRRL B-5397 / IMRU 509) TaxID=446468 RepID=D7AVD9_NOCDD|nr:MULTISPECIES: 3-hydroxybutyryl-CoA dehydrogenase [Nocardiopsis]ADH65800.1 3-hydroxybutyryl-CoA dehydrogenase [Nocardiopsis dassonvillei subsp. dassonvillei DSM 43111]NKY78778.1 3-hydroxyacyl-CoA dehydrogenase [Nocardiopsis dassonvillei]VEI91821.1 3-hydroxybutyryl-CoA dehydrogenase [Nocardiopsis dassonvillei]